MHSPFNLFIMKLILSGLLLTACETEDMDYNARIPVESKYAGAFFRLFTFTVTARQWRELSGTDRYVKVPLPDITRKIISDGAVIIYLNEADKNLSLPFTYYQVRRAMSFQPSYDEGHVYVNILGNFILNINSSYTFSVLVIDAAGLLRFKDVNWYNYNEVKRVLRFK